MTATLTYQLPEEAEAHRLALAGPALAAALCDMDNHLRGWQKHGHTFATADDAITYLREHLSDTLPLARGDCPPHPQL